MVVNYHLNTILLFGDYPNATALLLSHTNIYLNKYSNDHLKIMVNITKHNQTPLMKHFVHTKRQWWNAGHVWTRMDPMSENITTEGETFVETKFDIWNAVKRSDMREGYGIKGMLPNTALCPCWMSMTWLKP